MGLVFTATPEDFGLPTEDIVVVGDLFETVEYDYSEGCDTFVEVFLQVSQDLVPVDTGNLMSTLDASTDGFNIQADTDCEYAQYVEYGTWKMNAQPYFLPALEEALEAALVDWMQAREEQHAEVVDRLTEEWEEIQAQEAREAASQRGGGGMNSGSVIGNIVGIFIVAVILVAIQNFFDLINPRDSSSSSYGDGDSVSGGFIGNIENMIEIT